MTASSRAMVEDWIDRQRHAVRPLPITVVPAHNETLASYLARLAAANRLTTDHLRRCLTGSTRKSDPIPLPLLAVLSRQRIPALKSAIHELTDPDRRLPGRPDTGRAGLQSSPCSHCSRGRGHSGRIVCWTHQHTAVCLRHARWLGADRAPTSRQLNLHRHPDILEANRLHRRLVRRAGRDQAADAYNQAAWVISRWHAQRNHDEDFQRHMASFHGPKWGFSASEPTIAAATYPQTIALTRLLASPHWRAKAALRPLPNEFIAEVRASVAPRFQWTLARYYSSLDPLIETVIRFESKVEGDGR